MVHDARMRQLVQKHIVNKVLRQEQQITGQVDIPARRATAPTAGAGVNLYLVERQAMLLRQGIQARGQH